MVKTKTNYHATCMHFVEMHLELLYTVQQNWTDNKHAVRIFSIRYYGNLYKYKPGKFAGMYRILSYRVHFELLYSSFLSSNVQAFHI